MIVTDMHTRSYQSSAAHKKTQKRRRVRKLQSWVLVLCAAYVGLIALLIPGQALAGSVTPFAQNTQAKAIVPLSWPGYGQAAIGSVDEGVLSSHGTTKPMPTASTIKILTALSVLSKYPLGADEQGPTVTITAQDVDYYHYYIAHDGSVISVRVGQKMTERKALEAMLLRSANNMADTLARWAFGSHDAYRNYATGYAKRLSLTHTTVGIDASGLSATTTSTASDLVKLGDAAMRNPALASVVGEKSAVIPGVGTIYNTNSLLGHQGIVGIKTGNNDEDPGAYLFAAKYQPPAGVQTTIVGAILGAPNLAKAKSDALSLLASAKSGFAPRTPIRAGDIVGQYTVPWSGEVVDAIASKDVTVTGWRGNPADVHVSLKKISGTAEEGQSVGSMSGGNGAKLAYLGDVTLASNIRTPSFWWRLSHPFKTWQLRFG
jgi:D-alanyl-D-alanine carboxypeptidase (penicillin-binding protein 5/6)